MHPIVLPQYAVGNRVTLLLADGGSQRVALPFAPTGPLATAAMQALQALLPADTWWALYSRWLSAQGGWASRAMLAGLLG